MARLAVAIACLLMGTAVHVRSAVRDEDDFAPGIPLMEGVGVVVVLAIGLGIAGVVHFFRGSLETRAT